ncbi:MAG: lipid A-modifier LpxR family protein [Ferruginibacter sp.]
MIRLVKYLLLVLLLPVDSFVSGQGTGGLQVLLTVDNDFFGFDNKDESYTGGAKVEVLVPGLKLKWVPFYKFKGESAINIQRFAVGGTAYTPRDISVESVIKGDRPYASLMFLSAGNNSYSKNRKWIMQSDIVIGVMGARGPGSAQAYIHSHHWFGSERPVPKGWNNQIGYDGSFVANYNTRLQKKIVGTGHNNGFEWLQLNLTGRLDLGNYMTNIQPGVKLNLLNWNTGILQEYSPDILTLNNVSVAGSGKIIRFNIFAEPQVRFAAYNSTLEGALFNDHSIYKIEHSNVKRILFEINGGANLLIGDILYIRYSFYGRSREFKGGKPFHTWAGITVGISPARWNRN